MERQKRICQRWNQFSDFAFDCKSEILILKSNSSFSNRKHPKSLIWNWFFILMQIKLIFTLKDLYLASFLKKEFLELVNGLIIWGVRVWHFCHFWVFQKFVPIFSSLYSFFFFNILIDNHTNHLFTLQSCWIITHILTAFSITFFTQFVKKKRPSTPWFVW